LEIVAVKLEFTKPLGRDGIYVAKVNSLVEVEVEADTTS
jgi:hypothetical protein